MTNRAAFRRRHDGSIGLMGHVIADYPSRQAVRDAIAVMADAGVEVIEIQLPFSEPVADGPRFLKANHQALAQGVGYDDGLRLMEEVTAVYPSVSFVFMTYLNIVFRRGYEKFATEATAAGAKAVIIPDLPFDTKAAADFDRACRRHLLANISLAAPNTPDERLRRLCDRAEGFIYAVARTGVTGSSTQFGHGVHEILHRLRRLSELPIAVGFGVKGPEDIRSLRGHADYAIVGTEALKVYEESGLPALRQFWQALALAKVSG